MIRLAVTFVCISCLLVLPVNLLPQRSSTCSEKQCLRSEVCVMEYAPCFYGIGQCGRIAVCQSVKPTEAGSCANVRCPPGQYCSLNEEWCSRKPCVPRPMCITSNSTAYGWSG